MAQKIGASEAKKFGDSHEEFKGNPKCEEQMDKSNNATGRGLGANNSNGSCTKLCSNAKLVLIQGSCTGCKYYSYYSYYDYNYQYYP